MLRAEFEELVGDLLDAAVLPLQRLLAKKPVVDAVEVLGGSVRIPALQHRLQAQLRSSLGQDMPLGRWAAPTLLPGGSPGKASGSVSPMLAYRGTLACVYVCPYLFVP